MKKEELKPCNLRWIDCTQNMLMTLWDYCGGNLEIIYNNAYVYCFRTDTKVTKYEFNHFREEEGVLRYDEFLATESEDVTELTDDILAKMKNYLRAEDTFIFVDIDLFDWMPGSICYQKYHWDHNSLLVKYSEEKQAFLAMDECDGKYETIWVTEEKLKKSLKKDNEGNVLWIKIEKQNPRHELSCSNIIHNAEVIIKSIGDRDDVLFYHLTEEGYEGLYYFDLCFMYLFRLVARQEANAKLFEYLNRQWKREAVQQISEQFLMLSKKWERTKNLFVKMYKTKRKRNEHLNMLNEMVHNNFRDEKNLWKFVIRELEPMAD